MVNILSRMTEEKLGPTLNEKNWIDILPIITLCTLDIICETAMGYKLQSMEKILSDKGGLESTCEGELKSKEYVESLHEVSQLVLIRLSRPWLWPDYLFYGSSYGRKFLKSLRKMQDFTMDVILERKRYWLAINDTQPDEIDLENNQAKNTKKRLAFLDLLLNEMITNKSLDMHDIRDEVDTFLFAVSPPQKPS